MRRWESPPWSSWQPCSTLPQPSRSRRGSSGPCPLAALTHGFLRGRGVSTRTDRLLDRMTGMFPTWRLLPPAVVVLALGVIPAVFEELFFRGFLFSALRSAVPPRTAIVLSSIL